MADEQNGVPQQAQPPIEPGSQISPGQPTASQTTAPPVPAPIETPPNAFADDAEVASLNTEPVEWTASEFIAHEKSPSWYAQLGGAALLLAAVVYLLTKDYVSCGVILFGAILLGVYAARQPRQLEYRVDKLGVHVGGKQYAYHQFKSFAVMPEGAFSSIALLPLKRFAPMVSIYYAPADEDKIIDLLAEQLPFEQRQPDAVDRLMRRIRF